MPLFCRKSVTEELEEPTGGDHCHGRKARDLFTTRGAETDRRAKRDMQAACQRGQRASVFDPWNGKEPEKTAKKTHCCKFRPVVSDFPGALGTGANRPSGWSESPQWVERFTPLPMGGVERFAPPATPSAQPSATRPASSAMPFSKNPAEIRGDGAWGQQPAVCFVADPTPSKPPETRAEWTWGPGRLIAAVADPTPP